MKQNNQSNQSNKNFVVNSNENILVIENVQINYDDLNNKKYFKFYIYIFKGEKIHQYIDYSK
jgi:hypothetical protein